MSSVICFLSVIMAWYGVNFVLGVGLHSYGFVEGGSQGVVSAVVLAVLPPARGGGRRRRAARAPARRVGRVILGAGFDPEAKDARHRRPGRPGIVRWRGGDGGGIDV